MAYIGTSPSNGVRRRFVYEATASQTSFSGNDENGITLTYVDSLYLDVYQNGVKLKAGDDYTATTGTSVVLAVGASANDVVEMVAFDVFSVNDSVSASDGGNFAGNIGMGGTLAVTGIATFTDDIIIGDGKTIGSASDVDAMTISSGGVVTFSQVPVGAFIPEFDQYRITTNTSNTADADITANWERVDDATFEKIGTGISQSSGIFSFPSTGKYFINAQGTIQVRNGTAPQGRFRLFTTQDNSTYVLAAQAEISGAADQVTTVFTQILFNVTNITNDKVKLNLATDANNIRALASSDENRTHIQFVKVGDT